MHEDLTVRENLAYSAWLRSNIDMISEAKGEVVDDVLDLLRLRHVQVVAVDSWPSVIFPICPAASVIAVIKASIAGLGAFSAEDGYKDLLFIEAI